MRADFGGSQAGCHVILSFDWLLGSAIVFHHLAFPNRRMNRGLKGTRLVLSFEYLTTSL